MMKKKTAQRRAISVRGSTYDKFKAYCDRRGVSCSGKLEKMIAQLLIDAGEDISPGSSGGSLTTDGIITKHFTFPRGDRR